MARRLQRVGAREQKAMGRQKERVLCLQKSWQSTQDQEESREAADELSVLFSALNALIFWAANPCHPQAYVRPSRGCCSVLLPALNLESVF